MKQTKNKTRTQTLPPLLEEAVILYKKVELFLELYISIYRPATFKKPENQSYDAKIGVTDESLFEKVFDHSTAEELDMIDASVEGQNGSGVGSHDVVCGLVQMKLEEPGNSDENILLKDGNKITARRVRESCLDTGDENWLLGIDRKKDSSLNWEPQLLGSDEDANFSYAGIDGILQRKQTVQSAIEHSLMLGRSKVSTAEKVFSRSSNSKMVCELLHIQNLEFGGDILLKPSKASDLEQRISNDGENVCAFEI